VETEQQRAGTQKTFDRSGMCRQVVQRPRKKGDMGKHGGGTIAAWVRACVCVCRCVCV